MRKTLVLFAAFLLCATPALALSPGVGNGPGNVFTQSCGSGALAGGQFCNESGSSAPTNNCTVGAIVVLLGNGALYACTTTNTWTILAGSTYTASTNLTLTGAAFSLSNPLTTNLVAGSGAPTCGTDYFCSSQSTTAGGFSAGGSSTRGDLTFGVHHSAAWTITPKVDFGDLSTAQLQVGCATTACTISSQTDAGSGNVPLTINGGAGQLTLITINSASTIHTGPVQVAATSSAVTSYVAPTYTNSGTAVASTWHCIGGKVTAAGASTTVTLSAPSIFADTSYALVVENFTTLASAVITAQATGSFAFTSISSDVYNYAACGP